MYSKTFKNHISIVDFVKLIYNKDVKSLNLCPHIFDQA